jgi:predicted RNase H-like HicB family nuclease
VSIISVEAVDNEQAGAFERAWRAGKGDQQYSGSKIEREEDGRWIGEVPELPGVLAYGSTEAEARIKTTALALRIIADRIEHGEPVPFDPGDPRSAFPSDNHVVRFRA